MKARVVGFLLLALVGRLGATEPAPEMKFAWVDPSSPAAVPVRQAGLRMIDILGGNLVGETERLLATVGLNESVELLHLQNLKLPRAIEGRPKLIGFKFTSYRIRNPRNAPDAAELAALDYIRDALKRGSEEASQPLVQKIERAGAPDEWRVYRPLATMTSCLYCHGAFDSLQPAVRAVLHRRFPEDQAVNYGAYDWRGIVRVSYELPAPPPPAPAK